MLLGIELGDHEALRHSILSPSCVQMGELVYILPRDPSTTSTSSNRAMKFYDFPLRVMVNACRQRNGGLVGRCRVCP